ncbi:MAG: glycoside hydrolase family 16 protein, partial [Caldilineaceae bacterium]
MKSDTNQVRAGATLLRPGSQPVRGSKPRPNRMTLLRAMALIAVLLATMGVAAPRALAQQPLARTIVHDTAADFGQPCVALSAATISNAQGGEVRLAASVEDYFSGATIDSARWLTGSVYSWYQVPPLVANGQLLLDAAFLRSQLNLQSAQPRFFEARARVRAGANNAGWADLGFYRQLPPLDYGSGPYPNDSSLRIFVARDDNSVFVRGRDGDQNNPLYDVNLPAFDLAQDQTYRIEWDGTQSRFFVNGALLATTPGVATLNTWAFLYHQTPTTYGSSPMLVDWVRAGQYAPAGSLVSCPIDAGQPADWRTASWLANGALSLSTRSSADGLAFSDWAPVSGGLVSSPDGRFLQYRIELATANPLISPE